MIPILRFHDYQSNWSKSSIGDIAKVTSGGTPSRANKEYWGGDIPWVTTSQIDFDDISNAEEFITDSGLKNSAAKLFPKGTILLALYGQGVTRGRVSVLKIDATTNQACAAILLNSTDNDTRFVFYYLQSKYESIRNLSNGGGQKNLSGGLIKSLPIALPIDISEQKKIAEFLTSVDTKISQLTEKHRLFKEYKKGVMQQIFSQKIRFRDDDGEAFPKWTENRLDYFIERVSNPVDLVTGVEYREIGIRSHGKGIFHKNPVTSSDIGNKRVFWVKEKALVLNIVFAWERAVAVTSDSESGFIASHRFPMYLPKENRADVNYLLYFLLSPKGTRLLNIASPGGAGRNKTLGQSEFAKLKVCLPSIKEQQKITQFLQAIDSKIEGVGTQLEQIKQFKKGLLQQMFV